MVRGDLICKVLFNKEENGCIVRGLLKYESGSFLDKPPICFKILN